MRRALRTLRISLLTSIRRRPVTLLILLACGFAAFYYLSRGGAASSTNDRSASNEPASDRVEQDDAHRNSLQHQLIDWHDYAAMQREAERDSSRPGEHGVAVADPPASNSWARSEMNAGIRQYGFNTWASDRIAVDRSIRDLRHAECTRLKYWAQLPTVSVVIPVRAEHWATLLRTIVSVIDRSPRKLLREIIVVDDANLNRGYLRAPTLDRYFAKRFAPQKTGGVRVTALHSDERLGLIRARMMGARNATGDVVIFLDSHCEAGYNWLPPLLQPIAENRRTVTCPFIDSIESANFRLQPQDEGRRGAFDWNFYYKRLPKLAGDLNHPARPFNSPVMAGGLFAIDRIWFWELGGYDRGLEVWGAEQYELSFKIWQCHGRMVDVPCSRVGHIYKVGKTAPDEGPTPPNFSVERNNKRVAEVWMDNYVEYLYRRRPGMRQIDAGNVEEQRAVRTRLACHDFAWFMKHVAFDLTQHYPLIEALHGATGQLSVRDPSPPSASSLSSSSASSSARLCLTLQQNDPSKRDDKFLALLPCDPHNARQIFSYTFRNQLMINGTKTANGGGGGGGGGDANDVTEGRRCIAYTPGGARKQATGELGQLSVQQCHVYFGEQFWKFHAASGQLEKMPPYGQYWGENACVEADVQARKVRVKTCANQNEQRWTWSSVLPEQLAKLELVTGEF